MMEKPLGTGGATFKSLKYLKNNFLIIYGDSYLNFQLNKLVKKRNLAAMAIFKNNNKYDKSNIELKNLGKILYHKNNENKKLKFIDYGVTYVNKKIFKGIKKNIKFDLSDFFEKISKKNMLSGYKVKKRFYEIGSYSGIKDLKNYLKKKMKFLNLFFQNINKSLKNLDKNKILRTVELLRNLRKNKGRLFIIGVGGSAGNASHAVNDFRKLCDIDAYTPVDNISEITAKTNDEGFETIFDTYLKLCKFSKNDVLMVFFCWRRKYKKKRFQ